MIAERINQRIGLALLPVFLALGIFSVYYWYQSELAGMGDLRLYLIIQFLPAPLILYMLFFMPSRYSRSSRFGWILAIYVLAKLSEYFDRQIFELQHWISGHSIKHILAAFAVFMLAEMLRCRIPVKRNRQLDSELDQY